MDKKKAGVAQPGRAPRCQRGCRGSESLLPLQTQIIKEVQSEYEPRTFWVSTFLGGMGGLLKFR